MKKINPVNVLVVCYIAAFFILVAVTACKSTRKTFEKTQMEAIERIEKQLQEQKEKSSKESTEIKSNKVDTGKVQTAEKISIEINLKPDSANKDTSKVNSIAEAVDKALRRANMLKVQIDRLINDKKGITETETKTENKSVNLKTNKIEKITSKKDSVNLVQNSGTKNKKPLISGFWIFTIAVCLVFMFLGYKYISRLF